MLSFPVPASTGEASGLAGASVQIELTSEPKVKLKKKKWEAISSPRGEFAIRLPAGQTRSEWRRPGMASSLSKRQYPLKPMSGMTLP
jgi:hypothetical protein